MKPPIKVSLKEFLQTGMFGPVYLGMSRAEVIELLGIPDFVDTVFLDKDSVPINWCYGNVKFFFHHDDDRLSSIYCFRGTVPNGGRGIDLEPWIIKRDISPKEIEEELKHCGINYSEITSPDDKKDNYIVISVGPGVKLCFHNDELYRVVWEEQKSIASTPKQQTIFTPKQENTNLWLKFRKFGNWRKVKFTREQEALIPVYLEKWRAIAFQTGPIDRQKSSLAIRKVYDLVGEKEPEIIFFDSPYAALLFIISQRSSLLKNSLASLLESRLYRQPIGRIESQTEQELYSQLQKQLWNDRALQLEEELNRQLWDKLPLDPMEWEETELVKISIKPGLWAGKASVFDFYFSVLNCTPDERKWETFQSLVKNCGWIFPFEKMCIVCDHPIKVSFDNQQRLHAEGEPAIKFSDGFSLYAYHGVRLPEKYGKVHPNQWQAEWYLQESNLELRRVIIEGVPTHQWQAQWILEETNAELRRVLIQGIGYSRICQELQAEELDSWQEYTLLKIDKFIDVDGEPIFLLKMTCPSTGFIHVLRVPPDIKSAREAIRWVNWGIDPEEFSVQS